MNKIFLIITYHLFVLFAFGQTEVWSLQKCIKLGLENSYSLKIEQLKTASIKAKSTHQYENWLPNVNLYSGHFYTFGSTIDPQTNSRVSANFQNDNVYLNTSLTLFDLYSINQTKKDKSDITVQKAHEKIIEQAYTIQIIEKFFLCLLNQKMLESQLNQIAETQVVINKIQKCIELGTRPKNDLFEVSLLSTNELIKMNDLENELALNTILLFELINQKLPTRKIEFTYYSTNLNEKQDNSPTLTYLNEKLSNSLIQQKLFKNTLLPKLSSNYSISSFYYHKLTSNITVFDNFNSQININKNQQLGLQLAIPIYDRNQNYKHIQQAKFETQIIRTEIEVEKSKLNNLISTLQNSANYLDEKRILLLNALSINESILNSANVKLELGIIDFFTFNSYVISHSKALSESIVNDISLNLTLEKLNYLK